MWTSELREHSYHPEAEEVHAAQLESMVFVAERRVTRPAGNVFEVGSHMGATVVCWEMQPCNMRSFPGRWEVFFEEMVGAVGCCLSDVILPRTRGAPVLQKLFK